MATISIKDLTEQIISSKARIETEIEAIQSARENLDNIQSMAQTLANGFQSLQGSMNSYLEQNYALVRNTSHEQLSTIEEKFGETFSQLQATQRHITEFVENNGEMIGAVKRLNEELPKLHLTGKFSELAENFQNQVMELNGALNVIENATRENTKMLNSLAQDNQMLADLLQKELRTLANTPQSISQEMSREFKELNTATKNLAEFIKLELTIVSRNNDKILENQRGLNTALSVFFDGSSKGVEQTNAYAKSTFWVLLILNVVTILILLLK